MIFDILKSIKTGKIKSTQCIDLHQINLKIGLKLYIYQNKD